MFDVELQLWKIKRVSKNMEAESILRTRADNYLDVIVPDSWNDDAQYLFANETRVSFEKSFFRGFGCVRDGCTYTVARKSNMVHHDFRHDSERMVYKLKKFGAEEPDLMVDILPKDFNLKNVVMFDIEALMKPSTNGVDLHVPVMIAMKNNFLDDSEEILCRHDMSGAGLKKLVSDFLDKLVSWAELHVKSMPYSARRFLKKAIEKLSDKKTSPALNDWYKKRARVIQSLMELKVMGFNSMKYDTLALSNCLIDIAMERYGDESVKVIKKGLGIFNLQIDCSTVQIAFRDVMSYIPGSSLDKFAESWGVEVSKLAWPYTLYRKVVILSIRLSY